MKRIRKTIVYLLLGVILLTFSPQSFACTGTIIGKGVTDDGNPIIARTEDWSSCYNKNLIVTEAKTYKDGDMFTDVYGFSYPMPEKTYRYVSIPDGYQEEGDIFEAAGWNEMGVTMTATVTASAHEKALSADPLTEHGLYESSVVSVVLPRIKSAREGVEVLADIMDTRGVQEGALIVLADQEEIWYMELLTGHQYVAIKYPDNCYSVFPNCFMLGAVDIHDKENVIASKDIINLPKENGFLVMEGDKIHIRKTYAEELSPGNRDRLWGGINFLDPDKKIPHNAEEFELLQETDKKISVKDVMEMQRYRYEGTEFDANKDENYGKIRPIGVVEQEECHVIQIKKDYPKDIGGVLWVAMGNAEHAMYVPVIGPITETIKPYQVQGDTFDPEGAYWNMRQVSALSELDRDLYGSYVREYFDREEKKMIEDFKDIDKKIIAAHKDSPEKGLKLATELSLGYQQKAYDDAKLLGKELNTYFFDMEGDRTYAGSVKAKTPYVPSLLGEERKEEIYKERGIPLKGGPAQPLDKGEEASGKDELKNHWAKVVMEEAIEKEYLQKKDNTFAPNDKCSVKEFVQGLKVINSKLDEEALYQELEKHAIRPAYLMNRQTVAVILHLYGQDQGLKGKEIQPIKDDSCAPWAKTPINYVRSLGWLTDTDGLFRPYEVVTRAHAAQIYHNINK
ncbi:MAG: C69 family dipeptidase [Tissierellia bacterium]|nr:C69 family dipeptidase [Tissierellia bacterium]